jgi:carbamoyltransferase
VNQAVVLGLNFGTHDAAAAIVRDGMVVAAAEEERFTRVKQTKRFPEHAIAYCMERADVTIDELDRVAFFVDPRLQLLLPLANLRHSFPLSFGSLRSDAAKYAGRRLALNRVKRYFAQLPSGHVVPVRHHRAHAASAYLASACDEATVVTLDGRGEYETACVFQARGSSLARRHAVLYPHSIGYLYSMITRFLGFRPQRDEYKVMGLAAHGSTRLQREIGQLASFDDMTGRLRLDLRYFDHHRRPSERRDLFSDRLIALLGEPRTPGTDLDDRHRDIAFGLQKVTEDLVVRYVRYAHRLVPSKALCMAGGVALNAVANRAVIESGLFDSVFIQPAANDAGTSLGAAMYAYGAMTGHRPETPPQSALLGPAFSQAEIDSVLETELPVGYAVARVDHPEFAAAQLLADDHVIGWFQGRCEFGPRALGNRSILANPANRSNTARVNALIKRREEFRPLAPAVLEESADAYFELHRAGHAVYPYMLATAGVRAEAAHRIPAVVHADGSARVQTVSQTGNPGFWALISAVEKLTGTPVVLNTSFNGPDEPIVCSPSDAVRTFRACNLDALVIGQTVIKPIGKR